MWVFCAYTDWPILQLYHFMALKRDFTAWLNSKATDQSANSRCLIRIFLFTHIEEPGRAAQSVWHLTRKSGVLGSIPGLATYCRFSFRFFEKGSYQLLAKVCARSTVKPAYVVTSIKGSPALSSHIFWVPWTQINCRWTCIKGSPVLSSQFSGFPWVTP